MATRSKMHTKKSVASKSNLIVRVDDEVLAMIDAEVERRSREDPGGSHSRSTVVRGYMYEKLRAT